MPTEITVHGEKFQRLDYITSKWVGKIKINLKLKSARGKTVNESVRFRFFFFFCRLPYKLFWNWNAFQSNKLKYRIKSIYVNVLRNNRRQPKYVRADIKLQCKPDRFRCL